MCRKLVLLVSLALVLGMFHTSPANAADPDLVAHWKLDDGSGTAALDSSGNGNDGTLVGNPQWVAGKLGGALDFDGDGDYVDCGNDEIFSITDAFSLTVWINWRATGANWQAVIAKGDNSWRLARGAATQTMDFGFDNGDRSWAAARTTSDVPLNEWHHVAATIDKVEGAKIYLDGVLDGTNTDTGGISTGGTNHPVRLGENAQATGRFWNGLIDDARIFSRVLTETEILGVMTGIGEGYPFASGPVPGDGELYTDTWASLSWRSGDFAASHEVYIGDNFDDVNEGTRDSEVFRGSVTDIFIIIGFPGNPYPDGLVPGTTYYWRIDEVNDADPNSPWKGPVWSFSIPSRIAHDPSPVDNAEFVDLNARLTWTPGLGAKLHYIVFGDDFDEVSNTAMGRPNGSATYNPGALKLAKTYYWRVDEYDGAATHKGEVWSFTTLGAVSGPNPADGAVEVKPSVVLGWNAGTVAASHEVYLGTDADAVKNATTASPEYKGPKALGEESFDPGMLTLNTTYFWRIDEVNGVSPDSPWAGNVWSFSTGDFFVIDDFEDYDAVDNQIWFAWHDGLGAGAPGTPGYVPPNGTGSAVGDETTASYTEETIVNDGGLQSMPIAYNNNQQGSAFYSEVEHTLTGQRDWTAGGVADLSLWFRGYAAYVGSFIEAPAGTYTMTGSGADIYGTADQFHFAYMTLTGTGSIQARVISVDNTHNWAKAGVMIRDTLEPGSVNAAMVVTPGQGVSSQYRSFTDDVTSYTRTAGIVAPYWVKIERDIAGNITMHKSANGSTWEIEGASVNIPMGANVSMGLVVTSHDAALTCQAVFSNVTTTGNVTGQWINQDIGITSNAAEPLYVAVSNSTGTPVVVVHDDANAATIDTWTEWVIPLQTLADQGIVLTNVDRIAIGLGTKGNMTVPGGSGKIFIDDVRLNQPAPEPEPQP